MKSFRRDEFANLILFLAIILGAFVRFAPTSLAGFAINDGGMFAVMVDDLKASHYLLPVFTSYNNLNIPFAYPPLGFYFGRIISDLSGLPAPQVLRWLPAFFASLSIPAFYFFALRLTKTRLHAAFATLFFALMPRALSWFVMGGGLTRSPGQFFMLLTFYFVLRLYAENRRRDIFFSGFFGALTVLSHPESAIQTVVSALLFWVMLGHSRRSFINSVFVGALVLVLSSPWWALVIARFGVGPLFAAADTGQRLLTIFNLIFFSFTEEPYATFLAILGLIGISYYFARKDYLLPLWLIVPFLLDGRSATGIVIIPLAIMAASAFVDVILPALHTASGKDISTTQVTGIERATFICFFIYLIFSCYVFSWQISSATVYLPDQAAMQWVRQNTPNSARFVVLTGSRSVACDSVPEWFPALAGRQSLFTVQGTEWTLGKDFGAFVQQAGELQACVSDSLPCVMDKLKATNFDYIYVSKILRVDNCQPLPYPQTFPYFVEALRSNPSFDVVYETEGAIIYRSR